jgi:hypothetical protein
MVWYYVTLRLKHFWRFYSFNSLHPLIGIPLTILAFSLFSYIFFTKAPHPEWMYLPVGMLGLLQMQNGAANNFLKDNARRQYVPAKVAENFLIIFPFVVVLIYFKAYWQAVIFGGVVAPYSIFNLSISKPRAIVLRSPYLQYGFEFNYGFRVFSWFYVLHILLLVVGIISQNYKVYLLPFVIQLFFLCSIFGYVEDPFYIWIYRKTPAQFLHSKAWMVCINYCITFALFVVAGLIAYPHHYLLIISITGLGLIAVLGAMVLKYHFYPSAMSIQIAQTIFFFLCLGCIIIPALLVFVVAFFIFSYFRARARLKNILVC